MLSFETLDDKAVLITGAADGIGLALARAFLAGGARLFLADLAADRLAKSASTLGVASGVCDVTDPETMQRVVDRAWDEVGPTQLLCANAGVVRPGALLDVSREDADWQFEVNVWGVLNSCRPFVRRLRSAGLPGHVLITGSEASLSHPDYIREMEVGVYHMTKHAVLSIADALRGELASDGIGVSVLCPGPTSTELSANSAASRASRLEGSVDPSAPELGDETARQVDARLRTPDQVAEAALAGLRRGLFVIPTHPHIRQDVEARYAEILQGFDGL